MPSDIALSVIRRPDILAPAGNRVSFLAAIAAEADAIYCGLKQFSARMAAKNFSIEELAQLTDLAHQKNIRVYVALNTLLKSEDLEATGKLIDKLVREAGPDALIFQDLAVIDLARQAGYRGELHLSTLANVSFPEAFPYIHRRWGGAVTRVVVPRELGIEEIKRIAAFCPIGMGLEVFVHGAICYAVSGRCYWSSYLGGKSGLRGRCVQPCRRIYSQEGISGRFFSCQDLSLDVLVKALKGVDHILAWKIEGRKKNAHYVYYTTTAYKILRDEGHDPRMKKTALGLLERALGRPGTHYNFLPQRPQCPVRSDGFTGSGLMIGRVEGGRKPFFVPREPLMAGDTLRVGCEDEPWHDVIRVKQSIPSRGRLYLSLQSKTPPPKGTPVFLTDRREKALMDIISVLDAEIRSRPIPVSSPSFFSPRFPQTQRMRGVMRPMEMDVVRRWRKSYRGASSGMWLSQEALSSLPAREQASVCWWLPPVIWPDESARWQERVTAVLGRGARRFVLNAPWQMVFFDHAPDISCWAGPFCNIANPIALELIGKSGFKGAIISPELGEKDYLSLPKQSPIPLGIVLKGLWPLCLSRIHPEIFIENTPFKSPQGETAFARRHGAVLWVYPDWALDLTSYKESLERAGYVIFVSLLEDMPTAVPKMARAGLWNWRIDLS